jgi:hypothetical protein
MSVAALAEYYIKDPVTGRYVLKPGVELPPHLDSTNDDYFVTDHGDRVPRRQGYGRFLNEITLEIPKKEYSECEGYGCVEFLNGESDDITLSKNDCISFYATLGTGQEGKRILIRKIFAKINTIDTQDREISVTPYHAINLMNTPYIPSDKYKTFNTISIYYSGRSLSYGIIPYKDADWRTIKKVECMEGGFRKNKKRVKKRKTLKKSRRKLRKKSKRN